MEGTHTEEDLDPVFFTRSPIFDKHLNVVQCELYFCQARDGKLKHDVTMRDIIDSFWDASFEEVVAGEKILMHYMEDFYDYKPDLPAEQIGFGFSVADPNAEKVLTAVKSLARQGHGTYLTEFNLASDWGPYVEAAEMVKIKISDESEESIAEKMAALRKYPVKLCAVDINSHDEFERCKKLGFDFFQGIFLSRPWRLEMDALPANRMVVLQLLCGLMNPEVTPDEIVELLTKDARLAAKILMVINSAAFSLPREIESLVEAVVLIGLNQLRGWASLIALSTVDDKPRELMVVGMIRAKMCETLAEYLEQKNPESFFTVGLFSILDALLDKPIAEILKLLPLAESLKKALHDYEGIMGMVLFNVVVYEQGRWEEIQFPGLTIDDYREAYIRSMVWSKEVLKTLDS